MCGHGIKAIEKSGYVLAVLVGLSSRVADHSERSLRDRDQ